MLSRRGEGRSVHRFFPISFFTFVVCVGFFETGSHYVALSGCPELCRPG